MAPYRHPDWINDLIDEHIKIVREATTEMLKERRKNRVKEQPSVLREMPIEGYKNYTRTYYDNFRVDSWDDKGGWVVSDQYPPDKEYLETSFDWRFAGTILFASMSIIISIFVLIYK